MAGQYAEVKPTILYIGANITSIGDTAFYRYGHEDATTVTAVYTPLREGDINLDIERIFGNNDAGDGTLTSEDIMINYGSDI